MEVVCLRITDVDYVLAIFKTWSEFQFKNIQKTKLTLSTVLRKSFDAMSKAS